MSGNFSKNILKKVITVQFNLVTYSKKILILKK